MLYSILFRVSDVTMTVMACDRPKLLLDTIRSVDKYIGLNKFSKVVVLLDCGIDKEILQEYPNFIFINNTDRLPRNRRETRKRQMKNFDLLFRHVDTKYWFHTEDDWEFERYGFIEKSKEILSNTTWQVAGPPKDKFIDHYSWQKLGNEYFAWYKILSGPGGAYVSFTANPFLAVTEDVKKIVGSFSNFNSEALLSRHVANKFGMSKRVAVYTIPFYFHLGKNNSKMFH